MATRKKNKKTKFKKSKMVNIDLNHAKKFTNSMKNFALEQSKKEFDKHVKEQKLKLFNAAYEDMFINLLGIPLLTLRNRGYGKKRLDEFFDEMMTIFKDFHEQRFTSDDVAQAIKDETGFDLYEEKEKFIEWLRQSELFNQLNPYEEETSNE